MSEPLWFACTVAMAWIFVRLSLRALPDRRTPESTLVALTVLLNGKFLVKEIAFGQFNLPLALLIVGALIAVQARRAALAGLLVGLGVFVKPVRADSAALAWLVRWCRCAWRRRAGHSGGPSAARRNLRMVRQPAAAA